MKSNSTLAYHNGSFNLQSWLEFAREAVLRAVLSTLALFHLFGLLDNISKHNHLNKLRMHHDPSAAVGVCLPY